VYSEVLNACVVLFALVFTTVDVSEQWLAATTAGSFFSNSFSLLFVNIPQIILILEEQGGEWYIGCDDDRGNCGNHLRWHDALYYTIVTLTSVG
jgi:hypothetical protein